MKFCFSPVASDDAKILILGSMPGERSLEMQQYYAYPQNAFWYIMERLLALPPGLSYPKKIAQLKQNRIALWDVLMGCRRDGSLDSSIENDSIVINDFEAFFQQYTGIKCIFFNGAKAEQEYRRRVLPQLSDRYRHLNAYRLPSTSPAMATLNREQKLAAWSVINERLLATG